MAKKEIIPATVRNSIWVKYIGTDTQPLCFCCGYESISKGNFECGHITSKKNGGKIHLDNLRPICSLCNKSMGSQNMEVFMKKYGYPRNNHWYGHKSVQPTKNSVPKKSTPKKSTTKKSVPKKSTPKKSTTKKSVPKKSVPKKSTNKKSSGTKRNAANNRSKTVEEDEESGFEAEDNEEDTYKSEIRSGEFTTLKAYTAVRTAEIKNINTEMNIKMNVKAIGEKVKEDWKIYKATKKPTTKKTPPKKGTKKPAVDEEEEIDEEEIISEEDESEEEEIISEDDESETEEEIKSEDNESETEEEINRFIPVIKCKQIDKSKNITSYYHEFLSGMTNYKLKQLCRQFNIPVYGNKKTLIEKIGKRYHMTQIKTEIKKICTYQHFVQCNNQDSSHYYFSNKAYHKSAEMYVKSNGKSVGFCEERCPFCKIKTQLSIDPNEFYTGS